MLCICSASLRNLKVLAIPTVLAAVSGYPCNVVEAIKLQNIFFRFLHSVPSLLKFECDSVVSRTTRSNFITVEYDLRSLQHVEYQKIGPVEHLVKLFLQVLNPNVNICVWEVSKKILFLETSHHSCGVSRGSLYRKPVIETLMYYDMNFPIACVMGHNTSVLLFQALGQHLALSPNVCSCANENS